MRTVQEDSVDISKCNNIQIIGVPKGEEEDQEIENLFEKIKKTSIVSKENRHTSLGSTEFQLDPKRTTPRHIIIKMPRVKDKEGILKAAREKQRVNYKGVPIRL